MSFHMCGALCSGAGSDPEPELVTTAVINICAPRGSVCIDERFPLHHPADQAAVSISRKISWFPEACETADRRHTCYGSPVDGYGRCHER